MSHCDYEITGKNAAKVFQALGPAAELFCYVCNSLDGVKNKNKTKWNNEELPDKSAMPLRFSGFWCSVVRKRSIVKKIMGSI